MQNNTGKAVCVMGCLATMVAGCSSPGPGKGERGGEYVRLLAKGKSDLAPVIAGRDANLVESAAVFELARVMSTDGRAVAFRARSTAEKIAPQQVTVVLIDRDANAAFVTTQGRTELVPLRPLRNLQGEFNPGIEATVARLTVRYDLLPGESAPVLGGLRRLQVNETVRVFLVDPDEKLAVLGDETHNIYVTDACAIDFNDALQDATGNPVDLGCAKIDPRAHGDFDDSDYADPSTGTATAGWDPSGSPFDPDRDWSSTEVCHCNADMTSCTGLYCGYANPRRCGSKELPCKIDPVIADLQRRYPDWQGPGFMLPDNVAYQRYWLTRQDPSGNLHPYYWYSSPDYRYNFLANGATGSNAFFYGNKGFLQQGGRNYSLNNTCPKPNGFWEAISWIGCSLKTIFSRFMQGWSYGSWRTSTVDTSDPYWYPEPVGYVTANPGTPISDEINGLDHSLALEDN